MAKPRIEHVFVYYRRVGNVAAARAAVGALFTDIEAKSGVAGRLFERRDAADTWLEVYEPVVSGAAFMRLLAACVQRHGVAAHAEGGRRLSERFVAARAAPAPRALSG
jgi:hypothetical protein